MILFRFVLRISQKRSSPQHSVRAAGIYTGYAVSGNGLWVTCRTDPFRQKCGNPVFVIASCYVICNLPDVFQGIAYCHAAAAAENAFHVIIVITEKNRPGLVNPIYFQHFPDAAPFGRTFVHHLQQCPVRNRTVSITGQ